MKYALITGASSGLGKEFSIQLHHLGYYIIMVARNETELFKLNKQLSHSTYIICDLSKKEEFNKLIQTLDHYPIDLFINNAGLGYAGSFKDIDINKEIEMLEVNVIYATELLKYVLNRNCLKILNVASSAGLLPAGPYMSSYYASKSYLVSLTKALWYETNTYIGLLCPGPVQTNFDKNAGVKHSLNAIDAKTCVSYAIKMMNKNKKIIIPTFKMKCAIYLGKLLPEKILINITKHQQKKKL